MLIKRVKICFMLGGSAKICCVKVDNFNKPSKNEKIHSYNLNEHKPSIIFIPKDTLMDLLTQRSIQKLCFYLTQL